MVSVIFSARNTCRFYNDQTYGKECSISFIIFEKRLLILMLILCVCQQCDFVWRFMSTQKSSAISTWNSNKYETPPKVLIEFTLCILQKSGILLNSMFSRNWSKKQHFSIFLNNFAKNHPFWQNLIEQQTIFFSSKNEKVNPRMAMFKKHTFSIKKNDNSMFCWSDSLWYFRCFYLYFYF